MDPAPNAPFNPEPEVSTTTTAAKPDAVVVDAAAGEKRPADNGNGNGNGNPEESVNKKARRSGGGVVGEKEAAKRVAEIVLVLSAMWRMRGGGRAPTEAETELMAEAREKLVEMCGGLAPKDIVSRDRIERLIEDLGLNGRVKEQRLGFRGQRLSIKEKLELTKKKMEDSKKFTTQPTTYAPHGLQTNFGTAAENRGITHTVRVFPSDKMSSSPTVSAGGFPASSPPVHVSATSTSVSYQLPTNEVRAPTVSTGLPGSHLGRDSSSLALPRVDRAQIKSDGGTNASSYLSQVQVNSSTNHQLVNSSSNQPLLNAPTWSVQNQSASSAKPGSENKFPSQNLVKVEGTAAVARPAPQVVSPQAFRAFITQPASGNLPVMHQPSQGMNLGQAPQSGNNHNEIGKIVQRVLHPKLPEHPTWTPPSREYMNKAFTCQMCKLTVNEVETVILCDACEKGFHLKCLQLNNQKGIPRGGEWHCMSCLKLSGGKPLPPKYGRVMRSMNTPKMPSNTSVFQSSSDKKVSPIESKVSQQKIIENGSSAGPDKVGSNSTEMASDSKIQNAKDRETSSGTQLNNLTLGIICDSPSVGSSSEKLAQPNQACESSVHEEKLASESKSRPPIFPETISNNSDSSQPSHNTQVVHTGPPNGAEVSLKDCQNNYTVKQDEKNVAEPNSVESSGLSDFLHSVEWSGDVLQVVDGKKFYRSCCIGGVTYKVQDHALLHSSPDRLIPSKLQAMWEDTRNGSKLIMVNRCFFPADLPEAVGCPCSPESSELYESNNESIVMAGLIRGPCEVLPSAKFREESERQSQLGAEANKGRRSLFLCKWFYDEIKGVFRPVSG
ncbi:hypothetical protein ACOSQ3_030824 [Xanthoceras sorbifolium]